MLGHEDDTRRLWNVETKTFPKWTRLFVSSWCVCCKTVIKIRPFAYLSYVSLSFHSVCCLLFKYFQRYLGLHYAFIGYCTNSIPVCHHHHHIIIIINFNFRQRGP